VDPCPFGGILRITRGAGGFAGTQPYGNQREYLWPGHRVHDVHPDLDKWICGQCGVYCQGPDPNLLPYLVLADCSHPTQQVAVAAGGSVKGTITFYPPWTTQADQASMAHARALLKPASPLPLMAGMCASLGLFGLRVNKRRQKPLAMVVAAAGICLFAGIIGCIGNSGLAMTPGIYTYTIHAASTADSRIAASKDISVTVHCDSCP